MAKYAIILFALGCGLTFFAYKHHTSYLRFSGVIIAALIFVFSLYLAWVVGFRQGYYSAAELESVSEGLPVNVFVATVAFAVTSIYLMILSYLPRFLEVGGGKESDEEEG